MREKGKPRGVPRGFRVRYAAIIPKELLLHLVVGIYNDQTNVIIARLGVVDNVSLVVSIDLAIVVGIDCGLDVELASALLASESTYRTTVSLVILYSLLTGTDTKVSSPEI